MSVGYQHKENTLVLTGTGFKLSNQTTSRIEQWVFFPVIVFVVCYLLFGIVLFSLAIALVLGVLNFVVRFGSKLYYTELELIEQKLVKRNMFRKRLVSETIVSPSFRKKELTIQKFKQGKTRYRVTYGNEKPLTMMVLNSKKIKEKLESYLAAFPD